MPEATAADWDQLEALAKRLGASPERVGQLRRRMESGRSRPGSPYTLLVGRPDAALELFLARWINADAASALKQAGERPLVLGPSPGEVRPVLGTWPGWEWGKFPTGHLLAVRCPGLPGADLLAQIASLGYLDQVVLVSKLGQPLHQVERELVKAFGPIAATLRVLFFGLPGEDPSDADLADVLALAATQMRQLGFSSGRYLGAGVWMPGTAARPGLLDDVARFLSVSDMDVASCRAGMFQQGLASLLDDLRNRCEQVTIQTVATIPTEEADRLTRELSRYLSDLGRELERLVLQPRPMSTETLRSYVRDSMHGWGAYTNVEGFWLKYIEQLRPGFQAAFLQEVENRLDCLYYQPPGESSTAFPTPPALGPLGPSPVQVPPLFPQVPPGLLEKLIDEGKRIGLALLVGLGGYLATRELLPLLELPGLIVSVASYAAFFIGGILGYAVGRRFFQSRPSLPHSVSAAPQSPARVLGWEQVERHLTVWFRERIHASSPTPAEECRALAFRLGIEETPS